ncbi:MAG: hypothetical protein GKC10_03090 [Methanosarcinales archaeon]|nr:hypothetical protein [Methanosarcinales archaeon]
MNIENSNNIYLMMMYVYLKSYEEAIEDFESAVKNCGFPDIALEAVKQKYGERVERISREFED